MPISVRTGRRQVSYQKINESAVFVLSVLVPTNQKGRLKTGNPYFQTTFSCFSPYQASMFCAIRALFSMKARRGSTSSPIRVTNTSSAAMASSMRTFNKRRTAGSIVVSQSCSGFISPKVNPLFVDVFPELVGEKREQVFLGG